jgi:hypothetical protein
MSAANIKNKIAEIRGRLKAENRAATTNEAVFLEALAKALAEKTPQGRWEKYKNGSRSTASSRVEHAMLQKRRIEYR